MSTYNNISFVSKALGLSSLGVYAGLMTGSTIVKVSASKELLQKSLDHIFCVLGMSTSYFGTLSTASFAVSYFLSNRTKNDSYLLCGLLAAPLTGAYLWVASNIRALMEPQETPVPVQEEKTEGKDVELPPNHPLIYNEKGEKLECPFSKNSSSSNVDIGAMNRIVRKFCGIFSSIDPHLVIVSSACHTALYFLIMKMIKN